jgi:flagellar basal-body rod protein FlgF
MSGAAYVALSGLKLRLAQLDTIAGDISNSATAGYKGVRSSSQVAVRESFDDSLRAAIDVTAGEQKVDFKSGLISPTGRDLDAAIDGEGFFVLETPNGPRYTRNGHFVRQLDGTLTSADGAVLQGEDGPIELEAGEVRIDEHRRVFSGNTPVGRLKVVTFADNEMLIPEGASRFRAVPGTVALDQEDAVVRGRSLEESNGSLS